MSPTLVQLPEKPASRLSVLNDGTALYVTFPYEREAYEAEQKQVEAAPRACVFIYACSDAPVPDGVLRPGTIDDFAPNTLRWAIDKATHIASSVLDARNPESMPVDLAAVLLGVIDKSEGKDHKFLVVLLTDSPMDTGQYLSRHRPSLPHADTATARSFAATLAEDEASP